MVVGLLILVIYVFLVWLVFFKLKLIKFSIAWGVVSAFVGVHVLLIFLHRAAFRNPVFDGRQGDSTHDPVDPPPARTNLGDGGLGGAQHARQEGAAAVPVRPAALSAQGRCGEGPIARKQNVLELKGMGFRKYTVQAEAARSGLKAALSAATYTVAEARANQATTKDALRVATASVGEARAAANLAKDKFVMDESFSKQQMGAISQLNYDKDQQNLKEAEATLKVALDTETKARAAVETAFESVQVAMANEETARVAYEQQAPAAIEVARANAKKAEAELAQANYYLDNTTMVAPEDGQIINLQVQPGMVAGIFRIGAIASFIVDADRYVLATYNQENLKYVKSGQPVEVAMDLYPGQIFKGKVDAIWWGSGQGQFLPSGDIPVFNPPRPALRKAVSP